MKVKDLPNYSELQFISDSQDVESIKEYLGTENVENGIDAFFVLVKDGDYEEIYGIFGIIPDMDKVVIKLR